MNGDDIPDPHDARTLNEPRPAEGASARSPLEGVRVLDLTRVLAGPWCTQTLGDLGAEVIKIEHPERGDDTRHWGPPFLTDRDGRATAEAGYFLCVNRNKKSVGLDIANPAGRAVLTDLIARSDVLVENFKAGDLARWDLDYASLRERHPRLIYCSITGFGQTGSMASEPGYDYLAQAISGLMSVTGERDDRPGGGPQKVGIAISDILTGLYATIGVLAALREREASGVGQHLDLALLDVQVAALANLNLHFLLSGDVPARAGNAQQNIVPYGVFAAFDGPLVVACGNDGQFRRLAAALGRSDLADDPRFASNPGRVRDRAVLEEDLARAFRSRSADHWLDQLRAAGVPAAPINDIAQAFAHPQVIARGLLQKVPHALADEVPTIASPLRLSRSPVGPRTGPPTLGEHTRAVLGNLLGRTRAEMDDLEALGVIWKG